MVVCLSTPLVWNTGASLGLTPYLADFFDYVEVNNLVKDVAKNYVVGIGTVINKFQNDKDKDVFLPCIAYHLPQQISDCSAHKPTIKCMNIQALLLVNRLSCT